MNTVFATRFAYFTDLRLVPTLRHVAAPIIIMESTLAIVKSSIFQKRDAKEGRFATLKMAGKLL